jgi:transcriptional regulator with XRE-family HTH domain
MQATISDTRPTGTASCSRDRIGDGKGGLVGRSWVDAFDPQRLRAAREQAALTQRDLAVRLVEADLAAAGTDPATLPGERWARSIETERVRIIQYEGGMHVPRAQTLRRLALALGVDVFDLLAEGTARDLATLRARLGLTQADVAAHLHTVNRPYYSRVEQGTAPLHDPADQQRLAALLEIDMAELCPLVAGVRTTS